MAGDALFEATTVRASDPEARYGGFGMDPDADVGDSTNPLDSEDGQRLFGRLWTWWVETRDLHFESRRMRLRDHEFYDGRQWTPAEENEIRARGQEPLVFNLLKLMVDWVIGTERRTRIDWNVLPRHDQDVENAPLKKSLLKYVSDVNKTGWERSRSFDDAVKSGLGVLEDCVVSATDQESCTSRYQDWREVWWDAFSRHTLWWDARFFFRRRWLDLDYAVAMWPDREAVLRRSATTMLDPFIELVEDDSQMPALFCGSQNILSRAVAAQLGRARERVAVWECWFKDPKRQKTFESVFGDDDELNGAVFDATNETHFAAQNDPIYSLTEGVTEVMRLAFFCEGGLLDTKDSPYKHNRFPFTPIWGFRDHRDGMPYGLIRQPIDPQRDYNKRRSKALHLLTTNQKLYEAGAIDADSEDEVLDEADRPDGRIRLNNGTLEKQAFQIRGNEDVAQGHIKLLEEDRENILEQSGVTRENTGQNSNAVSGKAILAKQQQGAVSTAEFFDNLRLATQESGEKQLCNIEQFMSLPKKFRVLGPDGKAKWLAVNQPQFDPATGRVHFANDITEYAADFVVDEQDYRETVRMAQAETLFELIGNIAASAPQVALALLPFALDLTDLPNKAQLVAVVRQAAGMPPAGEENGPAALAAQEEQRQQQNAAEQRAADAQDAQTRLTNAKAAHAESQARNTNLQGRREALDAAGMAHAAVPLVPAADRLFDSNTPS